MIKINKYSILFCAGILLTSCKKDFLEVAPKGSLIASKISEYENLFYNSQSIGFDAPNLVMGDEVATLNTYFLASPLRFQRLFRWEADIYEPEETASELQDPMRAIYIYNKVINEVMDSEGGTEEAKRSLQAEAKASRAYFNMMLINHYGKPYNAATAASDLGIPLVKIADIAQTSFTRASVQQVYDDMITDLKEAIPLMPVNVPMRLRMCKSAAELTLAKIYWFMGNYEEALKWIVEAKKHFPTSFETRIYDYNVTYAVPTWSVSGGNNNLQSLMNRITSSFWTNTSNDLLLAPWANQLYTPNDQRLKSFSSTPYLGTGSFPVAGLKRRIGPFTSQVPQGVYLPDVELMQAECEARIGSQDAAKAILLSFRQKRMPQADAALPALDKNALIRFIIEERVREFALYGWRWLDMRRLSNDPLFKDKVYEHYLYNAQTGQTLETITLPQQRLTLRLPRGVISVNPDMENNP